ncbi:MAG TPA: putative Ig domain-containing protein [Gammaproteobacteria bacterium]
MILVLTGGLAACGGDDGGGQSEANSPGNSAPTISGNPPSQVLVGDAVDFMPTAADADGDVLTFSVENLPAWASFDRQTGRLTGVPREQDGGAYAGIRISVTDGAATTSLPPFTITVVYTANGTATLTWTPPTEKTDGSPVDLAGYRIYWGKASRNYSHSLEVGQNVVSYVVDNLTPARWYFAVTALDSNGLESDFSNEATKVVQ